MKKLVLSSLLAASLFTQTQAADFLIGAGKLVGSGTLENEYSTGTGSNTNDIDLDGYYLKVGGLSDNKKMSHSFMLKGFELESKTGNIDDSNTFLKTVDFNSIGYEFQYNFLDKVVSPFIKAGVDLGWHKLHDSSKYKDDNTNRYEFAFNIGAGLNFRITDYMSIDTGLTYRKSYLQDVENNTGNDLTTEYDATIVNAGLVFNF